MFIGSQNKLKYLSSYFLKELFTLVNHIFITIMRCAITALNCSSYYCNSSLKMEFTWLIDSLIGCPDLV